jgi:hypothetical protein
MTQKEQALLTEKNTKDEVISFQSKTKDLEIEEKLLRNKIGINKFKTELEELRKT